VVSQVRAQTLSETINLLVITHRSGLLPVYKHSHGIDSETFRIPPSMSNTAIRIRDEGVWSGVGGTYVCGTAAVSQLSRSSTRTDLATLPDSRLESLY